MLIDKIHGVRVLVVGDVMLDHFVTGHVDRVSPEAPALVIRVEEEHSMLGGAGNVAANIASLGGHAVLTGVVGTDGHGDHVGQLISNFDGTVTDGLVRSGTTKTTSKTRFIAGDRHLLRADAETIGLDDVTEAELIRAISENAVGCGAIVVSDYAKGVVTPATMAACIAAARLHGSPLIADPKRRDFSLYAGADLLTPNRKELEFTTGIHCSDLAGCGKAAANVIAETGAAVLLTRSEDGIALFQKDADVWSEPAQAKLVRDVSGAGDTVLAVCAVALAAGSALEDAAHVANVAAAIAVSKSGTSCVTPDELNLALLHAPLADDIEGKLVTAATAQAVREAWRQQGFKVGFTNGCFDLLHPGHVKLLAAARASCDRLVVGLNTDASVKRLKGEGRPVQTELARAEVIGALRSVDLVVLFDDDTPIDLIESLRPDSLIKGADYTIETVVGSDLVQTWGGRVHLIDLVEGQSSSRLIKISQDANAHA